ncbi:unnamed protein product [Dicrocoelium dendriticum]|nr:unnamed protein product [Dicrocoelium dendriticum]
MCAVRLAGSFKAAKPHGTNRSLFVIPANGPTNSSDDSVKYDFYRQLNELLRHRRSSDIVVLAGDLNEVGKLSTDELHRGGQHGVGSRNGNSERLIGTRESRIREDQAGFRRCRGCTDLIFTLRQLLEHCHIDWRSTVVVFLDIKGAFDSVNRRALWKAMTWSRGMKALTSKLASVRASRLPGWGPKDDEHVWLDTLVDMARNRPHWRSCCEFLCPTPSLLASPSNHDLII